MKREKVLSSLLFKFLERCSVQGIQFIVSIVLARILTPEDYGLLAIVMVFVTLANVFIQTGISTALIQNKQTKEEDYSTIFFVNFFISIVLYVLLYVSAPLIGKVYENEQLVLMLRVISVILLFGAYSSIVNARLNKELRFGIILKRSLISCTISGVIGIFLALVGAGIWALMVQQIMVYLLEAVIFYATVRWIPKLYFQKGRAKELIGFGWKLTLASFIDALYKELRSVLIGKKYTPDVLGYYNRARQFPQLLVTNINGAISAVMLPVLSGYQDEKQKLKSIMRRSIKTSTFIVFPLLAGLAAIAPALVKILLTEKWMPCVPILQLLCVNMMFYPIHTANLQAINAVGRSDIYLKLEVLKKTVEVIILAIAYAVFESVYAIVIGGIIGTVLESIINVYPNKKLLSYSYFEQINDILPSIVLTLIMYIVVILIGKLTLPVIFVLIIQVLTGVAVYVFLAMLFHVECFEYLISIGRKYIKK